MTALTRRTRRGLLASIIALVVVGGVFADQLQRSEPQAFQPRLLEANQLIGVDVENRQGEGVGQIEEIILNESQDRVQYVVLSFGGWLDVGEKLFAVPFDNFEFRPARDTDNDGRADTQAVAILNVSRERLREAPGFDRNRYPEVADPNFAQRVERFYGDQQHPARARARDVNREDRDWDLVRREPRHWSQDREQWRLRALSRVIGSDIEDPREWNIGDIEDVVLDAREGRVVYAIVSYGGALGVNEKQAVIPWRALSAQVEDGQYTLNITKDRAKETLDAVAYTRDIDLSDDRFARRVHEQFNAEPYWEVYGYRRGEQRDASRGWGEEDEFARQYERDEEQRIEGHIESIGTYYPEDGAAAGLRLRVRDEDGKIQTIFAGPQQFVRERGIRFYNGDEVTIVGSRATVNGRQGIIAREIRSDDQTLRLLDEQGRPQWQDEDLRSERDSHYLRSDERRRD